MILDYSEGAASAADSALLESHIAACTDCRAYLAMQQELDLRLAKSLVKPTLSPAFAGQLAARIAAESRKPQFHYLPRILNAIGYLSIATASGYLLQQLPDAGAFLGIASLTASIGFGVWQMGKALRTTYGHR
ncbi:MAG: hypothetical protein WDO73_31830 [Ignavibacteriota bacterium]